MAINDSCVTEVKLIMRQLKLTPAFLSGMLLGSPSQSMIYDWIRGDRAMPFDKAQRVLGVCKSLKQEADASPRPMLFKDVALWRSLLLKTGHSVRVRKQDESVIITLLARTPSTVLQNEGLGGEPEPVTMPETVTK